MKIKEIFAALLVILATAGTVFGILGIENIRRSSYNYVLETVKVDKEAHWSISEMTFPVGEEAKIMIRNTDVVSHGFAIPEFEEGIEEIKAGQVREIVFTPDKTGTFQFYCTVWCSDRHMKMRGTIIVQ